MKKDTSVHVDEFINELTEGYLEVCHREVEQFHKEWQVLLVFLGQRITPE